MGHSLGGNTGHQSVEAVHSCTHIVHPMQTTGRDLVYRGPRMDGVRCFHEREGPLHRQCYCVNAYAGYQLLPLLRLRALAESGAERRQAPQHDECQWHLEAEEGLKVPEWPWFQEASSPMQALE